MRMLSVHLKEIDEPKTATKFKYKRNSLCLPSTNRFALEKGNTELKLFLPCSVLCTYLLRLASKQCSLYASRYI